MTAVTDANGDALDGEWTDGVSQYPSGDSIAGGDFAFRVNVLPGDVNHSGVVNGLDIPLISTFWLTAGSIGGDTNGDGIVNVLDIAAIASNWLATLPSGGGGSGSGASSVSGSNIDSAQLSVAVTPLQSANQPTPVNAGPSTVYTSSISVAALSTSTAIVPASPAAPALPLLQPAATASDTSQLNTAALNQATAVGLAAATFVQ